MAWTLSMAAVPLDWFSVEYFPSLPPHACRGSHKASGHTDSRSKWSLFVSVNHFFSSRWRGQFLSSPCSTFLPSASISAVIWSLFYQETSPVGQQLLCFVFRWVGWDWEPITDTQTSFCFRQVILMPVFDLRWLIFHFALLWGSCQQRCIHSFHSAERITLSSKIRARLNLL